MPLTLKTIHMLTAACLLVVLSACSQTAEEACELANRPITLDVLMENSLLNAYNACLDIKLDALTMNVREIE